MAGLFNTPQDVQDAYEMQRRTLSPQQQLQGSLFNLGNVGGDAFQRGAFNTDTRSPQELKAAQVQEIARTVDWKDPLSIKNGMNAFNQAGFQQEAFAMEKLLPRQVAAKTPKSFGFITNPNAKEGTDPSIWEETITSPDGSGSKNVRYRLQQEAGSSQVTKVGIGEQGNVAADSGGARDMVFGGIKIGDLELDTMVGKFAAQPAFKTVLGNATDADMKGLPGLVKSLAEQEKSRQLAIALQSDFSQDQMSFLFGDLADRRFMEQAFNTFIEGGGFNNNISEAVGEGSVSISGNTVNDLATAQKNQEFNNTLPEAMDKVGLNPDGSIKGFVVGDPNKGEFLLQNFTPEGMRRNFANLQSMTNEQFAAKLKSENGVQFSPNMYESHAASWDFIRENPEVANEYLKANLLEEEGNRWKAARIKEMTEGNNAAGIATQRRITAYLDRLGESREARTKTQERDPNINPRTGIPYTN